MQLKFDSAAFAKQLRQKRIIDENIDLRTVAQKTGVSPATLSRVEKGRMPELLTYAALCRWLGVPMNQYIKKGK